jgi:tannase/feruloyl esterase
MWTRRRRIEPCVVMALLLAGAMLAPPALRAASSDDAAACRALMNVANLTILSAEIVPAKGSTPEYCHVLGLIGPAIHWHMQLPLPSKWNGRLVNIGNGGKAGNLIYADDRLAAGYAVANSNTGHDNGSEPYGSFAFNNRQEEIDFGYRAVHVVANASKTLAKAYYGKAQEYAYFEGCSTGGRQGMMEAQRFPSDFDGIVIGAPVIDYQRINMEHVWSLQKQMKEHFAGSIAYDSAGDRSFRSLAKLDILRKAVLDKCDAKDGIKDGVVDDPLKCDFNPEVDLASKMCPGDKNAETCFTRAQLQTVKSLYEGPRDSKGTLVLKGLAYGSEFAWPINIIPYGGNNFFPSHMGYEVDHVNFLFYENDPGVPPADFKNPEARLDKKAAFPEVAMWEFNIDDVTAGKGAYMSRITDAMDPDLSRFVKNGKMIVYQGWGDGDNYPNVALDYYKNMVASTFKGDYKAAHEKVRLFMAPGMGHCGGGPGPNEWDKLPPLAAWVEQNKAPDYLVAVHRSDARGEAGSGAVDNERKLCPYPQHAAYTGPAGQQNDPTNWVQGSFACREN